MTSIKELLTRLAEANENIRTATLSVNGVRTAREDAEGRLQGVLTDSVNHDALTMQASMEHSSQMLGEAVMRLTSVYIRLEQYARRVERDD